MISASTVLAIKREGEEMKYSPAADALLCAGDHLIVMGEPSRLRELEVVGRSEKVKIITAAEMSAIDRATTSAPRCSFADADGERGR